MKNSLTAVVILNLSSITAVVLHLCTILRVSLVLVITINLQAELHAYASIDIVFN